MKCLTALCALFLLSSLNLASATAQSGAGDRDRFVGAWKLIELDQPGTDGKLNNVPSTGMFVFTQDGHLSVQVMDLAPETKAAGSTSSQYSQGGYEASYGTFTVNEAAHVFTFHVDGALVRTLIGRDLPRAYEFNGNQLIVHSTNPEEHWRVVWQRF